MKINNFFRLAGDFVHVVSILLLFMKMKNTRSCAGLSLKSQLLYMVVYVTRYLDLFYFHRFTLLAVYNFLMKLLFLGSQASILYYSWFRFRATYSGKMDSFRIEALVVPALVLAFFFSDAGISSGLIYFVREYFWTFSVLLESVAILPQMFLLQKTGEAETITTHYLMALGAYRGLYLLNWLWRIMFDERWPEVIVVLAGILQTALYSDFFYIYYKRVFHGRSFKLPI